MFKETLASLEKFMEKKYICDRCAGRVFANLLTNTNNLERGKAVKTIIAMKYESEERRSIPCSFNNISFRKGKKEECGDEKCWLCNNIFEDIEKFSERLHNVSQGYEYSSFLIGIILDKKTVEREESFWEEIGTEFSEPLKDELSREIGKTFSQKYKKEVDFKNPDISFVINLDKNIISKQIKPLYVYGKYNKYKAMPQTKWICSNCGGIGCEKCNYTGKLYEESVEELIGSVILEESKGIDTKFHGAGREDVDALCYGWREFVIEIKDPKVRSIDLKKIEKKINSLYREKVEVKDLDIVDRKKVVEVKNKIQNKVYTVEVECDKILDSEEIKEMEKEFNNLMINQQTPSRVEHRRADKVRKKKVYYVKVLDVKEKSMKLEIKAESGTYIKELVHGDEGRTRPSISSFLGIKCRPKNLIVVGFEDGNTEQRS